MLDAVLYAIVAAFICWEAVAHYALHNLQGHTISNRIQLLEQKGGTPVRILVACCVVALGLHLEGGF